MCGLLTSQPTTVLPLPKQIVIKTITGREQKFDFEPSAKILDIKQKLQEQEGISSDQIRLVCGGKQLCVSRRARGRFSRSESRRSHRPSCPLSRNDTDTLEGLKVTSGTKIHMMIALR